MYITNHIRGIQSITELLRASSTNVFDIDESKAKS